MVPEDVTGVPLVMIHGGTVTGKSYEATPDGRMGWKEYFVRQGHPVHVPDPVGRGRSGADISFYNEVRIGEATPISSSDLPWAITAAGLSVAISRLPRIAIEAVDEAVVRSEHPPVDGSEAETLQRSCRAHAGSDRPSFFLGGFRQ